MIPKLFLSNIDHSLQFIYHWIQIFTGNSMILLSL